MRCTCLFSLVLKKEIPLDTHVVHRIKVNVGLIENREANGEVDPQV